MHCGSRRPVLLTSKDGHHTQTLQPVVLWQKAQQSPWLNFWPRRACTRLPS